MNSVGIIFKRELDIGNFEATAFVGKHSIIIYLSKRKATSNIVSIPQRH